jgi:hypothetical protein
MRDRWPPPNALDSCDVSVPAWRPPRTWSPRRRFPHLRDAGDRLTDLIDESMAEAVLSGKASLRSAGMRGGLTESAVGPRLARTKALAAYADPEGPRDRIGRETFVPVSGPIPETENIAYRRLAACRAASVVHPGPYGGLRRAPGALAHSVTQSGLHADGPMRILYLQFGAERELRVPHG